MPVTRSTTRSVGEGRGRGQPQSGPGRMNPLARPTQRGTSQYPTESSSLASQVTTEFSHQTHFPGNFVVVNVKRIGSTVDFTLIPGAIKSANQGALPLSQSMRARPSNEQASVSVQYDPVEENHQASCDRHRDASNPICFHIQVSSYMYLFPLYVKRTATDERSGSSVACTVSCAKSSQRLRKISINKSVSSMNV